MTGDAVKFVELLRQSHPFLENVQLWSPGGLVEEALKIGRLIRKGLIETEAPRFIGDPSQSVMSVWGATNRICSGSSCSCASACFLIWAGGINRKGQTIGLHRPTIASTTFAALPPDRASVLYRQLLFDISNYLTEMEIPRRFIEVMTDTSSRDMRWLDYDEASSMEEVPSQRDRMLYDQLQKKTSDISGCTTKRIWKSRDAISEIAGQ